MNKKQYIILGAGVGVLIIAYLISKPKKEGITSKSTRCSNLQSKSAIKDCVAKSIESHLSEIGIGDCKRVQVDVSLTHTNISAINC